MGVDCEINGGNRGGGGFAVTTRRSMTKRLPVLNAVCQAGLDSSSELANSSWWIETGDMKQQKWEILFIVVRQGQSLNGYKYWVHHVKYVKKCPSRIC